jgi:hypothetical protein
MKLSLLGREKIIITVQFHACRLWNGILDLTLRNFHGKAMQLQTQATLGLRQSQTQTQFLEQLDEEEDHLNQVKTTS